MSGLQKVRIVMTSPGRGEVFLDDKKVENLVAFDFGACVSQVNRLHLTINVGKAEVESMAKVSTSYRSAGWRRFRLWLRGWRQEFS